MPEKIIISTVSAWELGAKFETTRAQKNEALRDLSLQATRLARQFDKVEYRHVLRAHNELADSLVNEALDR